MIEALKMSLLVAISLYLSHGLALVAEQTGEEGPATVDRAVQEDDLNRIILTPQAVARLEIKTTAIERREVTRIRTLGGQILSPPGRNVIVSAPVAGIIIPSGGAIPIPGNSLQGGDSLFGLLPINITGAAGSRENIAAREADFTAAQNRLSRTRQLVKRGGSSTEELEGAQAQLTQARAALILARAQGDSINFQKDKQALAEALKAALVIRSPVDGVLSAIFVAGGQTVAAGTPLFQVQSASEFWVRLPVFAGLSETVLADREVTVTGLNTNKRTQAKPITGLPSADPLSSSIDLYYELTKDQSAFREGERVLVEVPLSTMTEALVVPYAAIFQDIQGGAWVYESLAENIFARRRVQIAFIIEDQAVLTSGPPAGTRVVRTGVAELAGTEFGVDH